ncbi:RraA family protein [Cryobacterium sp. Y50]|uniref:RraA family protein n=1 Tax=Cryobacterium sp. Y50 TaxID=2048286 RepID=UPI000CE57C2F|nr:RraA family protein [Cryobacterium sp. Y50]
MTSSGGALQRTDLLHRLLRSGTATIYEAQGQRGALDSELRPLDPSMKVVGPALTVDTQPGDNLTIHAALPRAVPGEVLVINAHGAVSCGPWGDILTAAAMQAGIAGLVIDGAVRDTAAIIATGFPVFARGVSIRGTTKSRWGTVGQPINLAGTTISNGDIVVGDRDGLVVVDAAALEKVAQATFDRDAIEQDYRAKILTGISTAELLGLVPTIRKFERLQ